jgi:2-amino-4-hydroxy-6-hydroxymethyldihydropteridine diphosphokinase
VDRVAGRAPDVPFPLVAVAIGSNLGDRHAHLAFARRRLAALLTDFVASAAVETDPVDAPGPRFLNAAAVGRTALDPRAFLDTLLSIEAERGRQRPFRHAPRSLDLDLVLFGDRVIDEPGLAVPHPRFRERRFVLEPLASIAPDLRDPVTGATIAGLLERL